MLLLIPLITVCTRPELSYAYVSGNVSNLHGDLAGGFRLRLGDYRVLFNLEQHSMCIFGVRHRSEAYR